VLWKGWLTREGAAGRIVAQLNMSHCDVPTDCFSPEAVIPSSLSTSNSCTACRSVLLPPRIKRSRA
jgi:hypothetical protein